MRELTPADPRATLPEPIDERLLTQLADVAEMAARAAGLRAFDQSHRRTEIWQRCLRDVKLQLDRECQVVAEGVIHKAFPQHTVLGEESEAGAAPEQAPCRWIIDPIDGTVNFFHGLPWWCCSVAAEFRGRVVAGAVYAPVLNDCYTAREDGPALCNDAPIQVSATSRLDESVIATGLDKHEGAFEQALVRFQALAGHVQKMRIMGSAALDICQVACGKTEGFYESGIYIWDVAAAGLVTERAGGRFEILNFTPPHQLECLITNRHIHAAIKTAVTAPLPH